MAKSGHDGVKEAGYVTRRMTLSWDTWLAGDILVQAGASVADRSFGLNVARMAHLPESVIHRAALKAAQMRRMPQPAGRHAVCLGTRSDLC